MTLRRAAVAAALFAVPLAAAAQPAATPPPAPAPLWQVDWGPYYCSMIRLPGEGRPFAAAFLTIPSGGGTQLLIIPQRRMWIPTGVDALVLLPAGRRVPVHSWPHWRGDVRVLGLGPLPYDYRELLDGTRELQVLAGATLRFRIPVDRAGAALAEQRRCIAGKLQEWRVDEAALAALQQRPRGIGNLGFRSEDYPRAALRAATQGRVIARVAVSAEGRATDCTVVATSNSAQIDAATCEGVLRRAQFRPALDAQGRPVAAADIFTVTWRLP